MQQNRITRGTKGSMSIEMSTSGSSRFFRILPPVISNFLSQFSRISFHQFRSCSQWSAFLSGLVHSLRCRNCRGNKCFIQVGTIRVLGSWSKSNELWWCVTFVNLWSQFHLSSFRHRVSISHPCLLKPLSLLFFPILSSQPRIKWNAFWYATLSFDPWLVI